MVFVDPSGLCGESGGTAGGWPWAKYGISEEGIFQEIAAINHSINASIKNTVYIPTLQEVGDALQFASQAMPTGTVPRTAAYSWLKTSAGAVTGIEKAIEYGPQIPQYYLSLQTNISNSITSGLNYIEGSIYNMYGVRR